MHENQSKVHGNSSKAHGNQSKVHGSQSKVHGSQSKAHGHKPPTRCDGSQSYLHCRVAKQLSSCRECRSPTACLHQRYGSISWIRASEHMVGPARLGLPAVADNASYSGQPVISNTLGPNGIWSREHSLLTTGSPRETEGRFIIPPAPEAMILDGSSRTTAMFSHHMHVADEAGERALAVSSVNRV